MRKGFTLLEVLLATVILGFGLTAILMSMLTSQEVMLGSSYLETAQEVMDLGEMAYPLTDVTDPKTELEVQECKATELWEKISEERLSNEQEEKFHGYTWERECLNLNDSDDDRKRICNLYVIKVTVRWGNDFRGHHNEESYVTLWRDPNESAN